MLESKKTMDNKYPESYRFIGKDENGYNNYFVPIKENTHSNKSVINLDDALLDDDCLDNELPDEYYNCEWKDEPPKDENSLTQIDFMRMDFRESQYHIYKQLVNISSLLSYIKDVVIDDRKLR